MISYFIDFLGLSELLSPEQIEAIIPIVITVGSVFILYFFILFFQFILSMLDKRK